MRSVPSTGYLVPLALLGCAGSIRMAPCPAEGGPAWHEVQSPHFSVRTDLPLEDARAAARQLESLRAAILAAAWPKLNPEQAEPLEVVVLRNQREFGALFGEHIGGLMASGNLSLMALFGTPADWRYGDETGSISASAVAHELTHHISELARLKQPPWLSEGLASYLETIQLSADKSLATVGDLNLPLLATFKRHRSFLVRDAISWKRQADHSSEMDAFYATSWLFVHWLYNTHREAFVQYQARLIAGHDEASAWQESFPDLDLDTMDRQLFAYAQYGRFTSTDIALSSSEPALRVSQVGEAEVHAIRARLGFMALQQKDRPEARAFAAAEVREALSKDPNNLTALMVGTSLGGTPAERLALARRAAGGHAGNAVVWLRLAGILEENAADISEVERAYLKAIELSPEAATALNNLAWLYVKQGRMLEALPLSTKVVQLAPEAAFLDTHARALAGNGRCAEALSFHRRAIALLPGDDADENKHYQDSLSESQRQCRR